MSLPRSVEVINKRELSIGTHSFIKDQLPSILEDISVGKRKHFSDKYQLYIQGCEQKGMCPMTVLQEKASFALSIWSEHPGDYVLVPNFTQNNKEVSIGLISKDENLRYRPMLIPLMAEWINYTENSVYSRTNEEVANFLDRLVEEDVIDIFTAGMMAGYAGIPTELIVEYYKRRGEKYLAFWRKLQNISYNRNDKIDYRHTIVASKLRAAAKDGIDLGNSMIMEKRLLPMHEGVVVRLLPDSDGEYKVRSLEEIFIASQDMKDVFTPLFDEQDSEQAFEQSLVRLKRYINSHKEP